jgi:mRNA-degrading endonuclease RelE of RelBE toxin-antitoxin system
LPRELYLTRAFERLFRRLPTEVQQQALAKLALYLEDSAHPSLRVKRMKGTDRIWEMSVTMQYRITFAVDGEAVTLRRIGTHDVLRRP